ncbi:MAG: hypothetical protein OXJ53_17275 [Gammaproteobacteria bacterium]|nr:hypothetical protein [Gammaproteobacteria bacterium]
MENFVAATPFFAMVAAIASAYCAVETLRLSKRLEKEAKADEKIVLGPLGYAECVDSTHQMSVISCALVNPSRRRGGYIDDVCAYDETGNAIRIHWSSSVDNLGWKTDPGRLIAVPAQASLYVRRSDGENISYMRIEAHHSFSDTPITGVFSILGDTATPPS